MSSSNITGNEVAQMPVKSHSSMRKEAASYIYSSFAVVVSSLSKLISEGIKCRVNL